MSNPTTSPTRAELIRQTCERMHGEGHHQRIGALGCYWCSVLADALAAASPGDALRQQIEALPTYNIDDHCPDMVSLGSLVRLDDVLALLSRGEAGQ